MSFARCGSGWRVGMIDKILQMMLPSSIALVTFADGGGANESDGLEFVWSGVNEAPERLDGDKTLNAIGRCGWGRGDVVGES